MLHKLQRFLTRLRNKQPTLFLLPGLILGQTLGSQLDLLTKILSTLFLILLMIRMNNLLALMGGTVLGLIGNFQPVLQHASLTLNDAIVIARFEQQGVRYPMAGLIQLTASVYSDFKSDHSNSKKDAFKYGDKFLCKTISLPWKNIAAAHPGELLVIRGSFHYFKSSLLPWEFDASLARRGYVGTCKIKYLSRINDQKTAFLNNFRTELLERFYYHYGNDEQSSLYLSLSLGVRDLLSQTTDRTFKDLGITHVTVLSGMQIGLIFFAISFFVKKIFRIIFPANPELVNSLAFIFASLISLAIVDLTFYEASAVRAYIASVVVALGRKQENNSDLLKGSLASLLILSLIWPGCWAEAGVQLSFAALFGIALGQSMFSSSKAQFISSCLLATVFTAILSSLWFKTLSLSGIIANFIVAPWFSVVGCYLGFLLIALSYFDFPLCDQIGMICRFILHLVLKIVEYLHTVLPKPLELNLKTEILLAAIVLIGLSYYLSKKATDWIKEYNLFKIGPV